MAADRSRRQLLGAAGAAVGAGWVMGAKGVQAAAQSSGAAPKILGICCSPRKGMTTFASLKVCLEAASRCGTRWQASWLSAVTLLTRRRQHG